MEQKLDFRKVCEHCYDPIHVADGKGTIIFINEAYTRVTGITPEQVIGRNIADIEREGKLYKGSVTERVLQRRSQVNDIAHIHGKNIDVLVTGIPVFGDNGEIELVMTNTRDISGLKAMEQELQSLTEERKKAEEELAYLRRRQMGDRRATHESQAMRMVAELIDTVAGTDVTVLITGESGTGKELAANEIYEKSPRAGKPFIKVNCAAIPAELLESELFGYEDGAFTGARKAGKAGLFELANTGVILLDEVGDMPMALQTKLLRVIQQRELRRIGGSNPIKLDIRIIASTNKDLRQAVREGTFREDLYYRLNVVPLHLKPLRERREDIPRLVETFCGEFNKKYGKNTSVAPDGIDLLLGYSWPGNIRELENLVERLVVTSLGGTITRAQVYRALAPAGMQLQQEGEERATLKEQVAVFEQEIIRAAVAREGSLRRAAAALGVDHSTLVKKCKRYGMEEW